MGRCRIKNIFSIDHDDLVLDESGIELVEQDGASSHFCLDAFLDLLGIVEVHLGFMAGAPLVLMAIETVLNREVRFHKNKIKSIFNFNV
jgi:hypothetical protein